MQRKITVAFAAALLFAADAHAQQAAAPVAAPDFSKVEIQATDLGKKTYMLTGQGGNITVAIGDDGIIMVDGQFAPLHDKIAAAIKALSPLPIKYLVNTHFHGDHTGGNEGFKKDGVVIVADPNVGKRLSEGSLNALTGAKTPPAPGNVPTQTYANTTSLKVKGRTAQIVHEPAAHTDGDSAIYFADANVLSTGDIVTVGARYPNIDVANGGNVKGMIAAVDGYLKMTNADTKYVPGHGPLLNRAEITAYRDLLVAARDRVAKLIKDGKSEEDAVAAKPITDLELKAGANEAGSANFVRLVYRSLKT